MGLFDFLNPVVRVGESLLGDVPIIGDVLETAVDELDYQRGREDTHEDMQLQQDYALEQMSQQHDYNMAAMANQQTFNRQEREATQIFNAEQSQLARDFNASEAAKQRAWEEQMFDKENAYNSPAAQMQRLIDAGINPMTFTGENAIASVGSGASAASSPAASVSALGSSMANSGVLGLPSASNNPLTAAQIRLQNAQAANLEQQTSENKRREPLNYELLSNQVGLSEFDLKQMKPAEVQKLKAEYDVLVNTVDVQNSEIAKNDANRKLFDKQGDLVQKEVDAYADRLYLELQRANKELEKLDVEILMDKEQIKLITANTAKAYAEASLAGSQKQLADAQTGLVGVQKGLVAQQRNYQIIQNGLLGVDLRIKQRTSGKVIEAKLAELDGQIVIQSNAASAAYSEKWYRESIFGKVVLQPVTSVASAVGNVFSGSVAHTSSSSSATISSNSAVTTKKALDFIP